MTTISIDHQKVEAPDGSTILQAAAHNGIRIPTLCYHPNLSPSDSCRLCVVEVNTSNRPVTSCNTIALSGMEVITQSPELDRLRKESMNLILMDHPLDCPVCPAAGACEIQELTGALAIDNADFQEFMDRRKLEIVTQWPLIQYNPNLCVTCLRCVKVCHEVIGASALKLSGIGYDAVISTAKPGPLNCDFCGQCGAVCPTGAMSFKHTVSSPRVWELETKTSVCSLCSGACRIEANIKDNSIHWIGSPLEAHNKGNLCAGGRFAFDLVSHNERLSNPLIRNQNNRLEEARWDEALKFVANKFETLIRDHGPESVAGLAGADLSNENYYAFQRFMRSVIGTNSIDSEARFSILAVQKAFEITTGSKSAENTIQEVLQSKAVLLVGVDPVEETPSLGWPIKLATKRYDCDLVVISSRKTSLDRFARMRLRNRPYTEADLILGIMKVLLEEDLWDQKFVKDHVSRFLQFKNVLDKIPMTAIVRRSGVSADEIEQAAMIFGSAPTASILFGGSALQGYNGFLCALNIANLAILTGNFGKPSAGVFPLFQKGNLVGLCDMGVTPEYLPGYQNAAESREIFEGLWNAQIPFSKGLTALEAPEGFAKGPLRSLYLMAADPVVEYPNSKEFSDAFADLDFVVVQDMFMTKSAKLAHCVLPTTSPMENKGTITNIERRIQRLNKVIEPKANCRDHWEILERISALMGKPMGYGSPNDIFKHIAATVQAYSGLEMDSIPEDGAVRLVESLTPDTKRGGMKYSLAGIKVSDAPAPRDIEEYPYELLVGSSMYHFGSVTTWSDNLRILADEGKLEVHPVDATRLGLEDGEEVKLVSKVSELYIKVKITDMTIPGVVFAEQNFPDIPVYKLFGGNTNACRVNIEQITTGR